MNIAEALSGCARLEGIRWMLHSGAPRMALRRELSALVSPPAKLGPCQLQYARFGSGPKLTSYYDVHLRFASGHRVRPIAVSWTSGEDDNLTSQTSEVAEIQAEAIRLGVAAPFRQLAVDVRAWGMLVQIWPLDVGLPQLVRLSDPRYVREMLAGAHRAAEITSQDNDGALAREYSVVAVRYRPGKRHVLRYKPLDNMGGGTIFAKLYQKEKGARVLRVATQVADWLEKQQLGMASVRPLAYLAEEGVVLYPEVFGEPLSKQMRRPSFGATGYLERAGMALHALHRLPPAGVAPLRVLDFKAEIQEVERDIAHLPTLLPKIAAAIGALLGRARELHELVPQEPPTFVHRDFKCEHLLVSAGGLTLIDFDICAMADPAFDVGKFLADLRLWFADYHREGLEFAQERFLAGYAPGAPAERLVRARLYEAVELVKMAVLRARLFEHDAACRTQRLIGSAQAVMNDLAVALGLTDQPVYRQQTAALSA